MTELRLAKRIPRDGGGRSADHAVTSVPPVIPSAIVATLPSGRPDGGVELGTFPAAAPVAAAVPAAVNSPVAPAIALANAGAEGAATGTGTSTSTSTSTSGALPVSMGFGARLAAERLRQRLSIGDIATRLRLHPNQIRAIEAESLAELPSAPYVRGFVRNYARVLGLASQPLLEALAAQLAPPGTIDARTGPGNGVAPGSASRRVRSPAWSTGADAAVRPLVLAGGLLTLAMFAALGWFATHRGAATPPRQEGATMALSVAPAADSVSGATTLVGNSGAQAPSIAAPGSAVPAAPNATLRVPDNALLLRFSELAWVQVVQADGRIVLSQNNPAGSEQVVAGQPPFRLTVGNAQGVRIEFRGRDVDLAPHTVSGNVARLTIE